MVPPLPNPTCCGPAVESDNLAEVRGLGDTDAHLCRFWDPADDLEAPPMRRELPPPDPGMPWERVALGSMLLAVVTAKFISGFVT